MKNMKKVLFLMLLFVVLGAASVSAQIRIGGDEAPNAAAVLDLNVDDDTNDGTKGLALPRVNFNTNTAQITSGVANLTGMLVYNTNTTLGVGVYYWDAAKWVKISDGSFVEVDGIVGNEVTGAASGGGLFRVGSGTAASPYTLAIASGGVATAMIANAAVTEAKLAKYVRSYEWECAACPAIEEESEECFVNSELGLPSECGRANMWINGLNYAHRYSHSLTAAGICIRKSRYTTSVPQYRFFCYF